MTSAFVTNIAFPKFLEEVMFYLDEVGCFDVEKVLVEKHTEWTAPKDCCIGEDVYFMFSKTSIDTIKRLKCQLKNISEDDALYEAKELLAVGLNRGEMLYKEYGGCIFAKGVVSGDVIVDSYAVENDLHWRSRYFAPIDDMIVFDKPIHISDFRDFITISRTGAIMKLTPEQNQQLKNKLNL